MSTAINLTEGEEFLRPSANFWSGTEAVLGKMSERIFTVYSTVSSYTTVWFQLSLGILHLHIMEPSFGLVDCFEGPPEKG